MEGAEAIEPLESETAAGGEIDGESEEKKTESRSREKNRRQTTRLRWVSALRKRRLLAATVK